MDRDDTEMISFQMFIELAAVAQGTGEWLRRGGVNAGKVLNGIPALKRMQDVILLPGMNCEEVGVR